MQDQVKDLGTVFIGAWNSFLEAIPGLLIALIIVIVGILAARQIAAFFGSKILSRMQDPLMGRFLVTSLRLLIIVGAILLALRAAGLSGNCRGPFRSARGERGHPGLCLSRHRRELHFRHHPCLQPAL